MIEGKAINLKQHRIKLPDAIILTTALHHNIELLTLNKKLINVTNPFFILGINTRCTKRP